MPKLVPALRVRVLLNVLTIRILTALTYRRSTLTADKILVNE
jgi:hypothetical protein